MTVREDHIRRADGSDGIYGFVEKPDFALIIPAENDGFHLISQYRYPTGERSLEFPQGTSETDPLQAEALAQAELIEELGLRAGQLEHLGTLSPAPGTSSQRCRIYLATDLRPDTSRHRDPEEQDLQATWLPQDEFETQIRAGTSPTPPPSPPTPSTASNVRRADLALARRQVVPAPGRRQSWSRRLGVSVRSIDVGVRPIIGGTDIDVPSGAHRTRTQNVGLGCWSCPGLVVTGCYAAKSCS